MESAYRSDTCAIASTTVALVAIKILNSNKNRTGLSIYNNSSNSVYLTYGQPGNSGALCCAIIPTFANWSMPAPVYTGDIYAIRNAGTGTVNCIEYT